MKDEGLIERMRTIFVSIERYELEVPQLKKIIYGAIGMIITTVMAALLTLVIKK